MRRAYALTRRHGHDMVAGVVVLAFEWTITAASLLRQKCIALEKVLGPPLPQSCHESALLMA